MRLLIYSPFFFPRIGGLETVVQVLASEWTQIDQDVTVVTETPHDQKDHFPFKVLRQLSFKQKIGAFRHTDVVILANISLWGLLPLLFCRGRRPRWIVTHQIWYENPGRPIKPLDRLKKFFTRFASANISCSRAVDQFLKLNAHVIPNPYDHRLFRRLPEVERDQDLVFLGRLVSDKGADLLLDALVLLKEQGLTPSLTIIGSGPDLAFLQEQTQRHDLTAQVRFVGPQSGEPLVQLLNRHRFMVVPSRWNEPFGIVALEGIACGCAIIGSSGGGLPEAIGPCGTTFPNGDTPALAKTLFAALSKPNLNWTNLTSVKAHLTIHQAENVAKEYHQIISTLFPLPK
jgi:glycosyltransferase involved in cell wall biosynthesis